MKFLRLLNMLHDFPERGLCCATCTGGYGHHELATSRLAYCTVLYVEPPLEVVWKLELLQNAASHLLVGASKFQHVALIPSLLHRLLS